MQFKLISKNLLTLAFFLTLSFPIANHISAQEAILTAQNLFDCVKDTDGSWVAFNERCEASKEGTDELCEQAASSQGVIGGPGTIITNLACVGQETKERGEVCTPETDTCEDTDLACRTNSDGVYMCLRKTPLIPLTDGESCYDDSECNSSAGLTCFHEICTSIEALSETSSEAGTFKCYFMSDDIWIPSETEGCETGYIGTREACSAAIAEDSRRSYFKTSGFSIACVSDPEYEDFLEEQSQNNEAEEEVEEERIEVPAVTSDTFDMLNPLKQANQASNSDVDPATLNTPGAILSRVLAFAFPLAGFILFIMIFWGGFEMLYGAATPKSQEAGRQRITAALIGFFLLFATYWIMQILQAVFGIKFL